jgi:hypothetical protein
MPLEVFVVVSQEDVKAFGDSYGRNKAGFGLEAGQDLGEIQPSCPPASHGEEDYHPCTK